MLGALLLLPALSHWLLKPQQGAEPSAASFGNEAHAASA
jgi:hypothetical protein